ncbi:MAG: DegT/DnrJ/EryC1/StrS family aminotransferase [Candidatus Altiarchaeota archaeon]|nr:DegT/DnrJ/EryC1/StrS family aminotransferase [Candidatus Altiarchaeota archaeon]
MINIAEPDIGVEEKKAVQKVLDSGMITQGPKTLQFEKEFARYIGTKHAIAVSSGTAALHIALLAQRIGAGDEVITSPFTFIATANSIVSTGAKPIFADIEEDTYNIDPEDVKEKITSKTTAIMPVHLFGHPADMKALTDICDDNKLILIEDACQAHGASVDGKNAGAFGTGCFSFYPTKNMTTSEGGMITTDDEEIDKLARRIRNHGMEEKYHHIMLGFNFRTTDIASAIGVEQLRKLEANNNRRVENARYLSKKIRNKDITLPTVRKGCRHVFNQYTTRHPRRYDVVEKLVSEGIGYGIYYPVPIHRQKTYLERGYNESHLKCEKACDEVLSIPVHPRLSEENLEFICKTLNSI